MYLDNFFPRERVAEFRAAFELFRATPESAEFLYPCQGKGRVEHLLPFAPPFNKSTFYGDPRLLELVGDYLGERTFKLDLQTVISSPPGSQHQRWHQDWRYLFHPEERLPPYAPICALKLLQRTRTLLLNRI